MPLILGMEMLKHKIEHQLKCIEDELATWNAQCNELESRLRAQSELKQEIHGQLYLEEDSSSQSELLEAVTMEDEQIKSDLKEITQSIQESQKVKEQIVQHIEWIHNLNQQLINGM